MSYKIEEIEGIGTAFAARLEEAGIHTTEDLLAYCETPTGRKHLAEETGISEKSILKWTNHADLFRIKGIAGQFAELLEAAGVDTVEELRHRVPENLHERLVETNEAKRLVRRVPSVTEVATMIDRAKELDPRVRY